ncbi:hypothetical protein [Streptomyces mangrovisoli]|uniref:hypothetical protein n=1 Tax=Streptomyces mangrovisoli TaxID=1428628 RepID=UPI003B845A59
MCERRAPNGVVGQRGGGKAEPSFLVSHELDLDQAPDAYEHFANRDDSWTKVVLHPDGHGGSGRRAARAG